jgi:hypothetical protein
MSDIKSKGKLLNATDGLPSCAFIVFHAVISINQF